MFKDKLFFFAAQEWVNFFQVQTQVLTVPTRADAPGQLQRAARSQQRLLHRRPDHHEPRDGPAVPGQHHPRRAAVAERHGVPATPSRSPTPGFREGANNAIITSPNPQDQRKDNIRFDYRLNDRNQFTYRFSRYNWVAVDAFRGGMTFARTDWERPNRTMTASWTTQLSSTLINEATYTYSKDDVFINVFEEGGVYQRSKYGIDYPYVFQEKEIFDKVPTVSISGFQEIDGGPYPASSSGPIHTVSNTTTWVKGRHTFKGGLAVEYSARTTSTRST